MTAQDLKNAILQLAMQGKLVPQDQTEVEVDLRGIKPKPTEEISFDIPQTWQTAHVECICNTIPSKQYQILESEVRKSGQFPVISQSKDYIIGYTDVADKVLHHEEPIIAFGDHTTEVKFITFDFVVGADGVKLFEPNKEFVFPLFFYYAMQYYTFGLNKVGGYSRHYKYIKNKAIPLPPLAEQERIVAKIEELMPLVEEYGKAEERLTVLNAEFPDKLRKSILQQAIQGKLTERDPVDEPASELLKRIRAEKDQLIKEGKIRKEQPFPPISEEEMPFEIPEGWSVVRIGDVGVYKKGPFGSSITKNIFIPKGPDAIKVYEQKNAIQKDHSLGEYYIKRSYFNEKMRGFEVFPGDVIVSCAGTIGETYVLPDGIEQGIINQALMRMKIVSSLNLDYFLLYFDYVLKKTAQGSSKGSAIKNIPPFDLFKKMVLPIPPLAEQQRIVDRVNELLAVCERLE